MPDVQLKMVGLFVCMEEWGWGEWAGKDVCSVLQQGRASASLGWAGLDDEGEPKSGTDSNSSSSRRGCLAMGV